MTIHDITESAKWRSKERERILLQKKALRERLIPIFAYVSNLLNDANISDDEAFILVGYFMVEMAEKLPVGLQNEGPRPQE